MRRSLLGGEDDFVVDGGGAGDDVDAKDAAALVRGGDELRGDLQGVEFPGEQGAAGETLWWPGVGDKFDESGAGFGLEADDAAELDVDDRRRFGGGCGGGRGGGWALWLLWKGVKACSAAISGK